MASPHASGEWACGKRFGRRRRFVAQHRDIGGGIASGERGRDLVAARQRERKIGIADDRFLGRYHDTGLPDDSARWPATAATRGDHLLAGSRSHPPAPTPNLSA